MVVIKKLMLVGVAPVAAVQVESIHGAHHVYGGYPYSQPARDGAHHFPYSQPAYGHRWASAYSYPVRTLNIRNHIFPDVSFSFFRLCQPMDAMDTMEISWPRPPQHRPPLLPPLRWRRRNLLISQVFLILMLCSRPTRSFIWSNI